MDEERNKINLENRINNSIAKAEKITNRIKERNTDCTEEESLAYDFQYVKDLLDLYNKEKYARGYWEEKVNDLEKEKNCVHKDKIREKTQEFKIAMQNAIDNPEVYCRYKAVYREFTKLLEEN